MNSPEAPWREVPAELASTFTDRALALFRRQAIDNPVYAEWIGHLGVDPGGVRRVDDIPFLPVGAFRRRRVVTPGVFPVSGEVALRFRSSGTSGDETAFHDVADPAWYAASCLKGFECFYGDPANWAFLFLLPAYLEREGSSLVWMCARLAGAGRHPESGFFLDDQAELLRRTRRLRDRNVPTMLLGVSFALLDLADSGPHDLEGIAVCETGGMKGRRREMVRGELHERLRAGLGVPAVHSEYGMTELLSQAWSRGEGRFRCPPWMRVRIRDPLDPLRPAKPDAAGGIDVIDLANAGSCAFLATDDLGRTRPDGSFEVLGRFDHAAVRGCNLLVP